MKNRVCWIFFLLLFTKGFAFDLDPVGKEVRTGVKKYKLGDFQGSLEHFKHAEKDIPNDYRLEYNKGTTFYKTRDYYKAIESFEKVLKSEDTNLKAKALYNLGNTHYRLGDKKKAIQNYTQALSLEPNFEQAKKNLEIIRKEEKDDRQESESDEQKDSSNSASSRNQSSTKSQKEEEKTSEQEREKSLSKEEANRILESYKQDKVKRKKASSKWSHYNEIFW